MTEPTQHADCVSLDMNGYMLLGAARPEFDQWLADEDLSTEGIFYIRFGEGYVEAKCYRYPLRVAEGEDCAEWEWKRFPVRTVPPILPLLIDGTASDG